LFAAVHMIDSMRLQPAASRPTAPAAATNLAHNTAIGWKPRTAAAQAAVLPSGVLDSSSSSSTNLIRAVSSGASNGNHSGASSLRPTAGSFFRSASSGAASLRQWWGSGGSQHKHTTSQGGAPRDSSTTAFMTHTPGQIQPAAGSDSTIVEVWSAAAPQQQLQLSPYRQQLQLMQHQESASSLSSIQPSHHPRHAATAAGGPQRLHQPQPHRHPGAAPGAAPLGREVGCCRCCPDSPQPPGQPPHQPRHISARGP